MAKAKKKIPKANLARRITNCEDDIISLTANVELLGKETYVHELDVSVNDAVCMLVKRVNALDEAICPKVAARLASLERTLARMPKTEDFSIVFTRLTERMDDLETCFKVAPRMADSSSTQAVLTAFKDLGLHERRTVLAKIMASFKL